MKNRKAIQQINVGWLFLIRFFNKKHHSVVYDKNVKLEPLKVGSAHVSNIIFLYNCPFACY